jgi:hypothetical protein
MGRRLGKLSIEELFREIHRANPTDRGLAPGDQDHRYARKSALQSELIRRFGEHLEVQPEGEDLVALRHRLSGRDAAHARISALDEEARSWVRWQLDAWEEARPEAPVPVASTGEEDPLRRAAVALEAYDYASAQDLLREAFDASRGGLPEAEALLELFVDHLAMDTEALELRPRLSRAATRSSRARGLLATAASRLGRSREALELAEGLGGAAEVYVEVARQALVAEDLFSAQSALDRLRDVDPSHPASRTLGSRLEKALLARREARRQPAERGLMGLVAEGNPEATRDAAQAILAEHPDSTLARSELAKAERALAERERQRRRRQAQEEDRRRRAEAERRVLEVRDLLPGPEGLVAWTQLDAPLRERLRSPRLALLGELCLATRWRRCEEAVQALLALEFEGSAAQRLERLGPHRELLARTRFRGSLIALEEELRAAELEHRRDQEARRAQAQLEEIERRYQDAVQAEDWLAARRIARGQRGEPWTRRLVEASDQLDRAHGLRVYDQPAYEDLRDYRLSVPLRGDASPLVDAEQALLANRAGPVVWIRRLDLRTQAVLELVELRPPRPFEQPTSAEVQGDLVFLQAEAQLLVLRHRPRWQIADTFDFEEICGGAPEEVAIVDGRYAWVEQGDRVLVLDLLSRRIEAFGAPAKHDHALHHGPRALVARSFEGRVEFCKPRSPEASGKQVSDLHAPRCPAMGPEGRLLVLCAAGPEAYAPTQLVVQHGVLRATLSLPSLGPCEHQDMRLLPDQGLVFVCGPDASGVNTLTALALPDLEPKELWSIAIPRVAVMVGDRTARALALVTLGYHRARVVPLGEEPPRFSEEELRSEPGPPSLAPPFPWQGEAEIAAGRRRVEESWKERLEGHRALTPPLEDLPGLLSALERAGEIERGDALLAWGVQRYGCEGVVGFLKAFALGNRQEWAEAVATLEGIDPTRLGPGQQFLAEVLRNACLANLGRLEEAWAAARRARRCEPENQGVQQLERSFAALAGEDDDGLLERIAPRVHELMQALVAGRDALQRGAWRDLLEAVDQTVVWVAWEPGALYLICRAWQALLPEDEGSLLRARAAAGALLEALAEKPSQMPMKGVELDRAGMRALAMELLDGLVPGAEVRARLDLEDLVLAYEDGLDARELAEELRCTVVDVYAARRRFGLAVAPRRAPERRGWLERCGWSERDIDAQLADSEGRLGTRSRR